MNNRPSTSFSAPASSPSRRDQRGMHRAKLCACHGLPHPFRHRPEAASGRSRHDQRGLHCAKLWAEASLPHPFWPSAAGGRSRHDQHRMHRSTLCARCVLLDPFWPRPPAATGQSRDGLRRMHKLIRAAARVKQVWILRQLQHGLNLGHGTRLSSGY